MAGWLEAFAAHPKIGDLEGLRKKYGAFAAMSQGEQAAAAASASQDTLQARPCRPRHCVVCGNPFSCIWQRDSAHLPRNAGCNPPARCRPPADTPWSALCVCRPAMQELADWNARFERKFGHIFIICAAGKSAGEVLQALKSR